MVGILNGIVVERCFRRWFWLSDEYYNDALLASDALGEKGL